MEYISLFTKTEIPTTLKLCIHFFICRTMAKPSLERSKLIDKGYTILRSQLIKGSWAIVYYTDKGGWSRYSSENYETVADCNEAIEQLILDRGMIINDDLPIF